MMNFAYMMGSSGATMMLFSWITYALVTVLLVFGIIALWKYIGKK